MGPRSVTKLSNKPVNVKKTIRELSFYYRNYKKLFVVAVILSLIGGLAATSAILLNGFIYCKYIIPSAFITGSHEAGSPIPPINYTVFGLVSFVWLCVGLLTVYLVSNAFNWLESYLLLKLSESGSYTLRDAVFSKLNNMPIGYFDRTPSGDIMSRTINDVDNIGQALSQYLGNIFYWIFMIITMLVLMFFINPVLSLFAIVLIPIFLVINILIMKKVKPFFGKQQKSLGVLNGFIEENISGLKIISLFKMKDETEAVFAKLNKDLTKNSIVAQATTNMLMPINIFMNNMSFVILAAIGAFGMFKGGAHNDGWISVNWGLIHFDPPSWVYDPTYDIPPEAIGLIQKTSLLIIFTLCARNLNNPINQMISALGSLFLALASAERVLEVLKEPIEQDDPDAKELKEVYGLVEAEHLDFSYIPGKPVLKNVNFHVKPQQVVALVGPTGAGKTTIVNLITKFYEITNGDLKIDGISIKKIKRESLRKNITMVLQDTYLFSTSIYKNIHYGRLDASRNDVIKAAKMARAHNFIMQLPKGYDTVLEDNGSNLSQGQRQLLAIARAFLSNSRIVILDEATSSIDTKTEMEIQGAMNQLMKERTSFVIAHRLSTIKNADNILVINHGRIVEQGHHNDLIKRNGFYAELYNSQFKKGIEI
ncbi:MAG: ABC transporter ATP-binding protein/permease [Mycoplasmataceae bacterium]|nr:ABC transporter ATP-binding protein/permease [Mycoplasmataceae bacterium]